MGRGRDRAVLHYAGAAGDMDLVRVRALPARCGRPAPRDPVATFDVFWATYAESYPFFAARGVDWAAVRARYRPLVTQATTDDQLYTVFTQMLAPLHDLHTGLFVSMSRYWFGLRPGTLLPDGDLDAAVKTYVDRRDLHGGGQDFAQGRVSYADLPGHLGYLRVSGFSGYTEADDYASNSAALAAALDQVFTADRVGTLRGLVLDLRVNGGGDDALGLQIAARLTGRPYLAYAKRARNAGHVTRPQPITVRPSAGPRYTGPIAVLTWGSTVSAGETFTQALEGRTPRPIRIGTDTQGVFSDTMGRVLPNGWQVVVPNEEYLTRAGRTYDVTGLPPDIAVPVFTPAEYAADRDTAFDTAIRLLTPR
jgi:Peptidase family S41/Tricorn protease C1 domain